MTSTESKVLTELEIERVATAKTEAAMKATVWAKLLNAAVDSDLTGTFNTYGPFYSPGPYGHEREDTARFIRFMRKLGAKINKVWPKDAEEYSVVSILAEFKDVPLDDSRLVASGMQDLVKIGQVKCLVYRKEICERVVIGTREVKEKVPDPELLEAATKDIPMVETVRTIEDVEWQCHSIMGD